MNAAAAELKLENLTVVLDGKTILKRLSLTVAAGETVALLGASGSGKSTLLRVVAGLEPVAAGRVLLAGVDITARPPHTRGIGFVFQQGQLFQHRSVAGNISYGLENLRPKPSRQQRARRVQEMLHLVQLPGYEQRAVGSLSGGQVQRIALARALAPDPQLMLLDEPLSALDSDLRGQLATQLREILAPKTAIFVTHDRAEAAQVADRVLHLGELQ